MVFNAHFERQTSYLCKNCALFTFLVKLFIKKMEFTKIFKIIILINFCCMQNMKVQNT